MPAQDPELLAMARCRRHIEPLAAPARQRVLSYLSSLVGELAPPRPKSDPRQPSLPHTDAESPFDAQ